MYDTYMSTPGNTAKLGGTHSNIYRQHKEVRPWLGANLQCISQHETESTLYPLCQPGINRMIKISFLKKEGIMGKISYESVDVESLS